MLVIVWRMLGRFGILVVRWAGVGDPEEITGAVVLLCSQRAGRYITGTDIVIDGGTLTL
jgi:Dehydrogenases with different specificities (related to short-chain alcohol dehydrogenases)